VIHLNKNNYKIKTIFQHIHQDKSVILLQNHLFIVVESEVESNYKPYKISNIQHFQLKQKSLSSIFNHFNNKKLINQRKNNLLSKTMLYQKNKKQHQNLSAPKFLHQILKQLK